MKKILVLIVFGTLSACGKDEVGGAGCGSYNGHTLHRGKSGGCYYINSKGNKAYVDKSLCACY